MKSIKQVLAFALLLTTFAFTSCKKDSPSSATKNVTYDISGNFSGTIYVSYTTAAGGTANETITLPWSKAITYTASVDAAIIAITGNGGTIGQTVMVVAKLNGSQKSSTTATAAGAAGSFSKSAPVLTF